MMLIRPHDITETPTYTPVGLASAASLPQETIAAEATLSDELAEASLKYEYLPDRLRFLVPTPVVSDAEMLARWIVKERETAALVERLRIEAPEGARYDAQVRMLNVYREEIARMTLAAELASKGVVFTEAHSLAAE